jgi:cytochrome c5
VAKIGATFEEEKLMKKLSTVPFTAIFLITLGMLFLAACNLTKSGAPSQASGNSVNNPSVTAAASSNLDGQAIMMQTCQRCHNISRVTSKNKTAADWKTTVDRMIKHGAGLTPEQEQAVIDYLAQNYGK